MFSSKIFLFFFSPKSPKMIQKIPKNIFIKFSFWIFWGVLGDFGPINLSFLF